jgi:hypothetical protein
LKNNTLTLFILDDNGRRKYLHDLSFNLTLLRDIPYGKRLGGHYCHYPCDKMAKHLVHLTGLVL